MAFFTELEKNPKIHMEAQKTQNNQITTAILNKKLEASQYLKKVKIITIPDFNTC
jgi:hypothetical protein